MTPSSASSAAAARERVPAPHRAAASQPAPSEAPLLSARFLSRSYGAFQALKGISFDMQPGEIISVLGPSGCGKSTLLQLVAGLLRPDGGELLLNGAVIASSRTMLAPEKRGVNMVFQDYALWPHLSVYENIAYGLKRKRMARADIDRTVGELLELLRLGGLEKRLPPELSGGQQQRVAIARALATRPQLLLLDEPLSNLDMRLRVEMRTEMAELFRKLGTSVFHVTHDPEEAFAMADRLLIMRGGQIDQIGSPEECYNRPASRWVCSLLGGINSLKGEPAVLPDGATALRLPGGGRPVRGMFPRGAGLPDDPRAELLFRPEDAELTALDEADPSRKLPNGLPVTVLNSLFEGKRWRCKIESDCGQRLYLLHEGPLEPGSRQWLTIPEVSAFLYPETD
ncbi:iron(III) transport system ATP-binding protein [Paenibacillus sp. UNC496MF]|uniref:ABC transporter ATP-binding protein n=1 Tax=Paenibacillus sp. UNC496MF TaxID=1502753 RepID=UPI0008ED9669|nr:ABC transporter ATP-binding protein [Paenibacillus sp. UNC496MF]SFJ24803.1 iron(III) transport system ATP-binding protein [Paenibacillus sp. UNC496MF]